MFPTAEGGHRESMRRAVLPLDPAVPSNLSDTPGTGDRAGAKDKDAMDGTDAGPGAGPGAWPKGKVFAEAKTAVWIETEAGARAGAGGKVFAETGIMTGTGAWAEFGAEWRPMDAKGGDLPSMPRDPAAWLGQQRLQTRGQGQREQTAFSSVPTMLAETAELPAPALGKPLGLLSKAAWTKSSSSSSSKASSSSSSSSTTKASSLPSSSSPASKRVSQTAGSDNVSLVVVSSNSSNSNSSSNLGMVKLN